MKKLYTEPSIRRHRLKVESCLVGPSQQPKKLPATGIKRYIDETKVDPDFLPQVLGGDYKKPSEDFFIEGD